jgi:RNA polymerase subunit RPABC4/transcription elongation factor Spt4
MTEKKKYRVCFRCGKEISEDEATPIYKEVLDRETGELKPVVEYFLCKSCHEIITKKTKKL